VGTSKPLTKQIVPFFPFRDWQLIYILGNAHQIQPSPWVSRAIHTGAILWLTWRWVDLFDRCARLTTTVGSGECDLMCKWAVNHGNVRLWPLILERIKFFQRRRCGPSPSWLVAWMVPLIPTDVRSSNRSNCVLELFTQCCEAHYRLPCCNVAYSWLQVEVKL